MLSNFLLLLLSGGPQQASNGISEVLTMPGGGQAPNSAVTSGNNSFSGIYNDSAASVEAAVAANLVVDNYLVGQPQMSNGMYGQHELVAAISQITASDPAAPGGPNPNVVAQQQNKAFNKAKKNLWTASEAGGVPASGANDKGGKGDGSEGSSGQGKVPRGFGGGPGGQSGGNTGGSGGSTNSRGRYSSSQVRNVNVIIGTLDLIS